MQNFINSYVLNLEGLNDRQKLLFKGEILAAFKPKASRWMMPIFEAAIKNFLLTCDEPTLNITRDDLELFMDRYLSKKLPRLWQFDSTVSEMSIEGKKLKEVGQLIEWMV